MMDVHMSVQLSCYARLPDYLFFEHWAVRDRY